MACHVLDRAVRATLEPLEQRMLLSVSLVPVYNLQIEAPANQATAVRADVSHAQGLEILGFGNLWGDEFDIDSGDTTFTAANGHSSGVYLHSGEAFARSVDLEIPGRGFNYRFERKYRSGVTSEGALGHNWFHNYEQHLVEVTVANQGQVNPGFGMIAPGDVIRVDGGGRPDIYHRNPDGTYQSPQGYYTRLTKRPDGTFVEYDLYGKEGNYAALDANSVARLTSLRDRMGNTMRFQYDAQERLMRVTDTLGRPIDYFHVGDRLDRIVDFTGRTVRFTYDANNDLETVTTPAVTGTPNGNDFPQGKTTRYTYSSGFADPRLNHNLTSIIAPNENPSPQNRVFFNYNFAGMDVDRVQNQQLGGVNSSNIPNFGSIQYNYAQLPPPPPGDLTTPAIRVTVLDRDGNRTEYSSNQLGNVVQTIEFTNRNVRPGEGDYLTRYTYNADSKLLSFEPPLGNTIQYTYDSGNPDRMQQGNLLAFTCIPDSARGGDQTMIRTTYTYEPMFNQVRSVTEARGNDSTYVPQNGGPNSPARYTTTNIFDYQEGNSIPALAMKLGRTPAEITQLLFAGGVNVAIGDVNGDGRDDIITGQAVQTMQPTVNLLPGSNQAGVEGTTQQPIVWIYVHNIFGQLIQTKDPEANVTRYTYFSERDPNGDGVVDNPTGSPRSGGYLREAVIDDAANPIRNSGTNPPPTGIRTRYAYDAVGNVTRVVDGRGIATDYSYNQLNQVVQIKHAAAVDVYGQRKDEPLGLVPFGYLERFFYDANDNLTHHLVEDRRNTSQVGQPIPPPVGDINGDQYVDDTDLGILLAHFGQTGVTMAEGDLDGDTDVDNDDLSLLLGNYGFIPPLSFVDTRYQYDMLDNLVRIDREVSSGQFLTTHYRYDPNQNRVLTVHPEGNAIGALFDERDLLFQSTLGQLAPPPLVQLSPNDPTNYDVRGGLPSTYTYHYDGNRNLIESVDASDTDLSPANNSTIAGFGDRTRYIYDGFDRRTSIVDSAGNQTVYQYDPVGNLVRSSHFGPTGGPSPTSDGPAILPMPVSSNGQIQAGNLVNSNLLGSTEFLYDELSRLFQRDGVLFVNTIPLMRAADVADGATSLGKGNLTPGDNALIPGLAQPILGRVSQRYEYDRNSRTTFVVEDDTDTSRTFYDGAGRVIQRNDPGGNSIRYAYDDNSNLIERQETDVSQVGGIADEVFLTTYFYDSLDRLQREVDNIGRATEYRYDSRGNLVAQADASGPSSGQAINRRAFAPGALTVNTINDFGNITRYYYDGLSRLVRTERYLTPNGQGDGTHIGAMLDGFKIDLPQLDLAAGGGDGIIRSGLVYDRNSNLSATIDDQGNVTVYTYDNLDRRVTATDGLVLTTSPLDKNKILGPRNVVTPTPATINNPAFINPALIDQQLAATQFQLNQLLPLFPPLANQIQDNPPTTTMWGYEPEPIVGLGPGGAPLVTVVEGTPVKRNVLITEDENDNEIFTRFDALNRPIAERIFRSGQGDSHAGDPIFAPNPVFDPNNPSGPFPPVVGTNKVNYQYDGLSRLVNATDNNDPVQADDSIVRLAYDSLGRQIEETQQIGAFPQQVIDQGWRAENLRSELIYPNNRQLDYTYDALDRLNTLRDIGAAQPIADYDYIGRDRVLQRLTPLNGTRMTHLDNAGTTDIGYDGARRPIQTRHLRNINNSLMVGTQNQYDRADNLINEQKLHNPANSEVTRYDSGYRTTQFQRPSGQVPQHSQWNLDGMGNWRQVTTPGGPQNRQHSSQNEITQAGPTLIRSDDNGNTNTDANFIYQYDYRNRLRRVVRQAGGVQVALYSYDALDRRIRKEVMNSGPLNGTTFFAYGYAMPDAQDGKTLVFKLAESAGEPPQVLKLGRSSAVIEERNQMGMLTQQYVVYTDEVLEGDIPGTVDRLVIDRNLNGNNSATDPGDQRLFYLPVPLSDGTFMDQLYVYGLADINSRVVEGYLYDKYGRQTVFQPGPNLVVDWGGDDIIQVGGISQLANPYLFQGQRLDPETQLYNFGDRYLHTELGRFLTTKIDWSGPGDEGPEESITFVFGTVGREGMRNQNIYNTPVTQGVQLSSPQSSRVKVKFSWEPAGQSDSSNWTRVSTLWAGKQWGMIHIPRIGQEVIVDFLEGDPDRPIIIGGLWQRDYCVQYRESDFNFASRLMEEEGVFWTKIDWSGPGDEGPEESITFVYGKLGVNYVPQAGPYDLKLGYRKEFWEWVADQLEGGSLWK